MPSAISLQLIAIWAAVGLFTGLGWHTAAWIVSRILR